MTERMRQRIAGQRRKSAFGGPRPERGLELGVVHSHGYGWVRRGGGGRWQTLLRLGSFGERGNISLVVVVIILKKENSIKFSFTVSRLAWDKAAGQSEDVSFSDLETPKWSFKARQVNQDGWRAGPAAPAEQTFKSLRNCFRLLAPAPAPVQ